ncbi:MAG: hypothetical protein M3Y87_25025 [Myxococcota bacterium]|nr:hypothetical protein [Myxococcota bacterium]
MPFSISPVRPAALALVLAVLAGSIALATAQRRDRTRDREPPPVPADASVQWTVFVSAFGEHAARRTVASAEPASIPLPIAGWQCTYSAPNRAQVDASNWSEMRTLACRHGDAIVSTTGFCQVAGASWGARAGVLSLGTDAAESRVTVTLDCSVGR